MKVHIDETNWLTQLTEYCILWI